MILFWLNQELNSRHTVTGHSVKQLHSFGNPSPLISAEIQMYLASSRYYKHIFFKLAFTHVNYDLFLSKCY